MKIEVLLSHLQKHCPGRRKVSGLELQVFHDLLIAEEVEPPQVFVLIVAVVDGPDFPATVGQRPFVVLPHINVVLFFQISLEQQIKGLFLTPSLLDDLSLKVAFHLEVFIELMSFFIFHVQLGKKGALQHVIKLVSFLPFDIPSDQSIDGFPNTPVQSQQNGLFQTGDCGVTFPLKGVSQDDFLLLLHDGPLVASVLHFPDEDEPHKVRSICFVVDDLASVVVLGFQLIENQFHNFIGDASKHRDFLQVQSQKMSFF